MPNYAYEDFGISMKLPNRPGETIYFPVIQTCEEGETAWIDFPEEGGEEPEHPAPAITLTEASGVGHDHDSEDRDREIIESGGASDDSDGPAEAIAWTALAVGFVGLAAGTGGLFMGLRKK